MFVKKSQDFCDIFANWESASDKIQQKMVREEGIIFITEHGDAFIPKLGVKDRGSALDGYTTIGIHLVCTGLLVCKHTSKTHQVIHCENCNLRIVIPRTVKTIEGLGPYFSNLNQVR